MPNQWTVNDAESMEALGAELAVRWAPGDIVLLTGQLGAGKTTLVRGIVRALGFGKDVRSPTFSLMIPYPTDPPILHADLYRVKSWRGLGFEDYLDDHIIFIEWPDRAEGIADPAQIWHINIEHMDDGRKVTLIEPK